ncbi:hypothetical protein E2562_004651 [Oryza meyeriana var. granulata]|uniref:Uncharacterized protein n=1 Tax=Oryza meyeriana var. granulata TaxID=110450 RepID=A0A6G1DDT4_9ORYZ|nr:hypothetical protein E2562_004651 [Oryza meyeriana var. granulata]
MSSTLMTDAVVAAEAEDKHFDDVDRAAAAAEWRRRLPVASGMEEQQARELYEAMDDSEGILESLSSSTHILPKLAIFGVAVSVLMYGVFRRFVVIYDAFVPGRVAGAVVLLLAAALICWGEMERKRAVLEPAGTGDLSPLDF